jgi:hypothetical protein
MSNEIIKDLDFLINPVLPPKLRYFPETLGALIEGWLL